MNALQPLVGIPTYYKGTRFRSRLEARWAAFFDLIGWRWEYEPFDLAGWIPDFLIFGRSEFLVEVKPLSHLDELLALTREIAMMHLSGEHREVLAVGCTPLPVETPDWGGWSAGALIERTWWPDEALTAESVPDMVHAGNWHICGRCKQLNIHHSVHSFHGRPCGHAEGDHLLDWADPVQIESLWARARNTTQWKPGG